MSNWDFTNDSSSSSSSGDSDTSPDFSPTHPTTTSTSTSRTMTNGSHIPSHSHSQKPLSTAGHKSFPSNWKPSKNTGKSSAHQVSSSASSLPNSTATRRGHGHDEKEKKSRKKVAKACLTCQKSHLTCDEHRPCTRCVKKGMGNNCVEGVRKKAKYLMDPEERDAPHAAPQSVMSDSRSPSQPLQELSPPMPLTSSSRSLFSQGTHLGGSGPSPALPVSGPNSTMGSGSTGATVGTTNDSMTNLMTPVTQYPYTYQLPYMPKLGFSESYPTFILPNNVGSNGNGLYGSQTYDNPFPGFNNTNNMDTGLSSSNDNNNGYNTQHYSHQIHQPAPRKSDVWLAPAMDTGGMASENMRRDQEQNSTDGQRQDQPHQQNHNQFMMQQQLQQDQRFQQQQPQHHNQSQMATGHDGVGGQVNDGYWSELGGQIASGSGMGGVDGVGRGGQDPSLGGHRPSIDTGEQNGSGDGGFPFTSAAVSSEYEMLDQMFGSLSPVFAMDYDQEQARRDAQQSTQGQQRQQLYDSNTLDNNMPSSSRLDQMSQMRFNDWSGSLGTNSLNPDVDVRLNNRGQDIEMSNVNSGYQLSSSSPSNGNMRNLNGAATGPENANGNVNPRGNLAIEDGSVPWQTWTTNVAPSEGGPTPKPSHVPNPTTMTTPRPALGSLFSSTHNVNGQISSGGSEPRTASTLVTVGSDGTPHVDGFLSAGPVINGRAPALTPGEVYRTILKPYDYTEGYHFLMKHLTANFERPDILRVVRSLATFRPSLIALQMPMSEEDGVFLERSFQRTLIELEKLISYSATPTAVWRRTGELCLANPEFCTLSGYEGEELLKRKTYVYQLFDKPSTIKYWEDFSVHAFENTTQNFFLPITLSSGLKCSACLTIRRDIFDLPSVVIGQFLPRPE